jgi:Protein of unknown function (DUF2934)
MPAKTATAKTTRAPRKRRSSSASVSPERRHQMIEEFAYFRAAQRGFEGGDPVADWLLSEQEVDRLLSETRAN